MRKPYAEALNVIESVNDYSQLCKVPYMTNVFAYAKLFGNIKLITYHTGGRKQTKAV